MTTHDAAMSLYLNMNQNIDGKPNENYAREFMELFCLGPNGPGRHRQLHAGRRRRARQGVHRLGAEHDRAGRRRHAEPGLRQDHVHPGRYEMPAKTFLGPTSRP